MKTSPIIPVAAAALLLTATAFAQTGTVPAPMPRPAVAATVAPLPSPVPPPIAIARPSSGVAPAVAAVAQAGPAVPVAASTGEPQAPTTPPAPAIVPQAPRAPQAPQASAPAREPRASTGDAPSSEPAIAAPRPRGQLVNLRLEFTVTDQVGAASPVRKTITMNVADGESGRIRTNAEVYRRKSPSGTWNTSVPLLMDAEPRIEGGKIRLRASLDYQLLDDTSDDVPAGKTSIAQSVTAILSDGISTVLSQSADPLNDRKVTLEVKATIVK